MFNAVEEHFCDHDIMMHYTDWLDWFCLVMLADPRAW